MQQHIKRSLLIIPMLTCVLGLMMVVGTASAAAPKPAVAVKAPNQDWQLLLFTIPGCSSCIMMREQVIEPMIAAGIILPTQFEEVMQRSDADWQYVRGVGYKQIREIKVTYQTSLFPTLVAVDNQGNRLTENIVGMTSVEHYRKLMDALVQQLQQR